MTKWVRTTEWGITSNVLQWNQKDVMIYIAKELKMLIPKKYITKGCIHKHPLMENFVTKIWNIYTISAFSIT